MKKPFIVNCKVIEEKESEFSEKDYSLLMLNSANPDVQLLSVAAYSDPAGYRIKTDKGNDALIVKSSVEPSKLNAGQEIRIHRIPVAGIFYRDFMEIPGNEEKKRIEVRWE